MQLRFKIPLLGTLALSTLVLLLYGALRVLLHDSYSDLEMRDVRHRLQQVQDAIAHENARLVSVAGDYAAWDDTYAFMGDRNPYFPNRNLTSEAMLQLRIDCMLLVDVNGELVAGKAVDRSSQQTRAFSPQELEAVRHAPLFFQHASAVSKQSGLLATDRGTLMLGARPIVTSAYEGPIRGALLVGVYLDDDVVQRIAAVTHIPVETHAWHAPDLAATARQARERLSVPGTEIVVIPTDVDVATGFARLRDHAGNDVLLLEVSTDRAIYRQGVRTLNYVALALFFGGTGLNLVLLFVLNSQILRRLTRLSREVGEIHRSGDAALRISPSGNDELGHVANEINRMLDALQRSSAALRESEQVFRLTFESAHDAILWIEPGTATILRSNQRASDLTARPQCELVGQPLADLATPDAASKLIDLLRTAAGSGEEFEIETEIVSALEAPRTCAVSGARTIVDGRPIVQIVLRDLTQQRAMEAQRQMLEEQLRQAQKMEAIGQLAGGIAHDFNNILAGISGYADIIRTRYGDVDPKLTRYAGIIFEATQRASDLTNKLLTFARKAKKEFVPIDLNQTVLDVLRLLEPSFESRIAIVHHLTSERAVVRADRTQVHNLIMNLALNARDAMPDGGELRITSEVVHLDESTASNHLSALDPGAYLHLAVHDTGTGMDEAIKARLFEPFFTTKPPGKGTGLGLASVYGTVQEHRGEITVDSEPGKGSTFHVYLPLAPPGDTASGEIGGGMPEATSGTILLVDDDELVREVVSELLHELGYAVHTASDGAEAIRWYRAHAEEVDFVLLDMVMPNMLGSVCFEELRRINPEVRVILASGYANDEEVTRTVRAGAVAFLQKPIQLTKLAKTLAKLQRVPRP